MKFKHRTNKETTRLSHKTALVVLALKTLGKKNVDDRVILTISKHLNEKERKKIPKVAMYITSWIYEVIKKACNLDTHNNE